MYLEVEVINSLFGKKYFINDGEQLLFKGRHKFGWFSSKTILIDSSSVVVATISSVLGFPNYKYKIELVDNEIAELFIIDKWEGIYKCKFKNNVYAIIDHIGLKTSIFLNGKQIGFFEKNDISLFDVNNYQVKVDSNANLPIIVAIILSKDKILNIDRGITFDFGKMTESRPFDFDWRPS